MTRGAPPLLRFGTDGVRGVAITELTPAYVEALGAAAVQVLGAGTWLVGRDTRVSGPELEAALVRGLRAGGARVVLAGMIPTPALAFASATRNALAAMITASHNPYADNGVKIFAAGGLKLSDDVESQIERALESMSDPVPAREQAPNVASDTRVAETYVEHLVALFPDGALAGMRVVLDCANGAMSVAAPLAVRALGADVTVIHAEPNGTNINDRCGATQPASLAAAVVAADADVGLAFDGDGDRVISVDHRGNVIDGDRMIALGALQLQSEGALTGDTVVVTVMSNIGFHRAMSDAGITVVATAVGDRYVLEALDRGNYAIGGEQSGHVIYRHLATTGDGLLAGLRLLQHVHRNERSLAELAESVMITYPQVLVNVRVDRRHPNIAEEFAAEIRAGEAELGGDGRVLLRASGTEPLVRVMVEAATDELAQRLAEQLAEVVRARFGA
ncbi:MAG: phosphoglucosamine mutase [Ilumatobacteraceae bacterium]